jgi:hypothetical protein
MRNLQPGSTRAGSPVPVLVYQGGRLSWDSPRLVSAQCRRTIVCQDLELVPMQVSDINKIEGVVGAVSDPVIPGPAFGGF